MNFDESASFSESLTSDFENEISIEIVAVRIYSSRWGCHKDKLLP